MAGKGTAANDKLLIVKGELTVLALILLIAAAGCRWLKPPKQHKLSLKNLNKMIAIRYSINQLAQEFAHYFIYVIIGIK